MNKEQAKIFKVKRYPHFDEKIHWKNVLNRIMDPQFVAKHAFYPFIQFCQVMKKFPKRYTLGEIDKRDEPKTRTIMYSAHIDRYIYEYYAHLINKKYNQRVKPLGINNCSVAYRTNLGKSNVNFAKEAFYFLKNRDDALVIIGDFTKYFDNISHQYLKQQLCTLLDVARLPADYYSVFRSITKYSYLELAKILEYKNLERKEYNKLDRVFSPIELRSYKKNNIQRNRNTYGIPQGSAISACLSNVYLMELDKAINEFATGHCGFYRRYCDDFIVILPYFEKTNQDHIDRILKMVGEIPNVNLQPEKTQIYRFCKQKITSMNEDFLKDVPNGKNSISYLGFTFDGVQIRIRAKTISKFYQRMYRKIDNITKAKRISKTGKRIPMTSLFQLYSYKGQQKYRKNHDDRSINGNFLDYVDRADSIFEHKEAISVDTKHAWEKLNKRLSHPHHNSHSIKHEKQF